MPGEIELALETVKLLSTLASQVMEMLPDYEQKKRIEYHSLLKTYEDEKARDYPLKDDNKLIMYRKNLLRFISVFSQELEEKKSKK